MAYFISSCLSSILLILLCCNIYLIESSRKSQLVSLNESNWDAMLTGEWMVEFYAPWCPACKNLQQIWNEFSGWSDDLNIKVGQVDVTDSPGLSGRFMVTALPTIFHVFNGEFRQYRGSRDKEAFMNFIEEQRWKSVEPIPGWKSPSSIGMSIISYFFKMSQVLRAIHAKLMEEYGLPTWGSYLIFAVATIVVGALLGLLAVCTIDLLSPPKHYTTPTDKKSDKKSDESDEEDGEASEDDPAEDIVDENSGGDSSPVRKRKARKAD